jgi:hypothetical protein
MGADVCDTGSVRRIGVFVMVTGLLAGTSGPAWAEPSPSPSAGATATSGEPVCGIDAPAAVELSGLVATDTGYVAINDSNSVSTAMRIFFFDRDCKLTRSVRYAAAGARDPEDLAVAPDGTLWVADIGDNFTNGADSRRQSVALWKLAPGASTPVIHRLTYPDGPHDAEALVLDGNGSPAIVTKEPFGGAGLYTPTGPLQPNTTAGVRLKKAGTFAPRPSTTPNFLGAVGQGLVTGGANAPDGKRVALRTYADAYEWDTPDGDVVKAITTGTPRITPLPNEPQGESIAYSRDGKSLLTVSDQEGPTRLLRYQPVSPSPSARSTAAGATAAGNMRSLVENLTVNQVLYLTGAVGVLGLLLAAVGVLRLRRSR